MSDRVYEGPGFACGRCGRFDQEPWQLAYDAEIKQGVDVAKRCECGESWWMPVTLQGLPGEGRWRAPCNSSEPVGSAHKEAE